MPLTGTIVNSIAIAAGTLAGLLVKRFLSEKLKEAVMQAVSLVVMFVGIGGAVSACLTFDGDTFGTKDTMIMILSMVVGTVIGELIGIERRLDSLGNALQNKFSSGDSHSTFSEGMVSATLIFCIGAMAVVGSLDNGIRGNTDVLFAKSAIDGVTSVILASTLGIGVMFSAVSVFLYQGSIAMLGVYVEPYLTDTVISQMSFVGSILIFAIGVKMMKLAKLRIGNMLPAIFMPIVFDLLTRLWQ